MTKVRINISIDKKIHEKSKKNIGNISEFVENCLKYYLGLADGTYPTANDKDIVDEIGILQTKLFILNQNFNMEENIKKAEDEEQNRAWRFLWNDYRSKLIPDAELMSNAVEVLGMDADTLEDIMDMIIEDNFQDTNEWCKVYERYGDD